MQILISYITFHTSGIFLGTAKLVAACLLNGNKTQLTFALNQYDLEINCGSGSVVNRSLEKDLELPSHWMHEGTPYEPLKET